MSGSKEGTLVRTAMIAAVSLLACSNAQADGITWQTDMRAAHKHAQASGKPMLIQLTASWCGYCRKMKATTYADPNVVRYITASFVPVMLDADKHGDIVGKLNLRGLPATVVVAPNLVILGKLNGYQSSKRLTVELNKTLQAMRKVVSVGYARPAKQATAKPPTPTRAAATAHVAKKKPVPPVTQTRPVVPAFGGLSLVALREGRELKTGKAVFQMNHGGTVLYFANKDEVTEFRRSPERYWPKHGGQCVVSAASGQRVAGRPEFGVVYRDSVWMFENAEKMRRFVENPSQFAR